MTLLRRYCPILFALLATLLPVSSASAVKILMITKDKNTLNASEQARKDLFESWGHQVKTLWDGANQKQYDKNVKKNDVAYIPVTVDHWEVDTKLREAEIGVLCEERYLDYDMGFASSGWDTPYTSIDILDDTHEITAGFSLGSLTIVNSSQPFAIMNSPYAPGMVLLGGQQWGRRVMGAIDTGGLLVNNVGGNSTAAGRRVRMPWGGEDFNINALNENGEKLLQQSILWAAGIETVSPEQVAYWKLDEPSGSVAQDSSDSDYDGSVVGTASWIDPAVILGGLELDGSAKVNVGGLLGKSKSITLAGWANLTSPDKGGAELISLGDHVAIRLDEAGETKAQFYNGSDYTTVAVKQTFAGSGWRHFATTFDNDSGELKLYIDGVLANSVTTGKQISYSGLGSNTVLGAHGNKSEDSDFVGSIDEVHAYNYALTDDEVAELYGFVGFWKLDETSGKTAADSTIFGNDGKVHGKADWSTRCSGVGVFNFNGSSGYISVSDAPNLQLTSSLTIAAWVKGDQWSKGSAVNALVCKGDDNPNNYQLAVADGRVTLYLDDSDSGGIRGNTVLNPDEWYHVAATWDGEEVKIYVNGALDSAPTPRTGKINTDTRPLYLGARPGSDQFDGQMYDVRLYNRALTESDIAKLSGVGGYWKLDEKSGLVAADASGDLDGIIVGSPEWATGKIGGAVDLDGNTKVEINSLFGSPRNVSFSAWANLDQRDSSGAEVLSLGDYIALRLDNTPSSSYAFYYDGSGWTTLPFNQSFQGKGWHFFTVVFNDDNDSFTVYVDGIEAATMYTSDSIDWTGLGTTTAIGRHGDNNASKFQFDFDGRIDEVRVYDRALCPEEVEELFGDSGFAGVRILKWQEVQ